MLPWSPVHLGPQVLSAWWNPDLHGNTSYMVDDGAGLISSFSSMVTKVTITGATTARPTWTAAAWTPSGASKAGTTFNGTTNFLSGATLTGLPTGSTAGEIFVSIKNVDVANVDVFAVYGGTGAGAVTREMFVSGPPGSYSIDDGVSELDDATTLIAGSFNIFGSSFSGTTIGGRINGSDTSPATAVMGALATGTDRVVLGGNISLGTPASVVYRHVIVTKTLTASQRQLVEGFLAWDGWISAATNTLPTTHPYKYVAPQFGDG